MSLRPGGRRCINVMTVANDDGREKQGNKAWGQGGDIYDGVAQKHLHQALPLLLLCTCNSRAYFGR